MQNEFTELEAKREAMHAGVDRLLATLKLSRRDFGTQSDADILYTLADTFAKTASPAASLTTLKLAATARDLETLTDESVAGFFAAHDARMIAERTVSPAAQELAASWQ